MSMDTRVVHSSEIGVISEAVKDSGDVGVSAYLSANPKLKSVRGMVQTDKGKLSPDNFLSTSALLAATTNNDDPKRMNFVSIMNGHTIPIAEMKVPSVRTGYEAILPYRVSEQYCYMAREDGVVESVSKKNIKILFKSGKKKTVKLGEWTSKEESGVSYMHNLVTDLNKGDKFKAGNTISYDEQFFEPDIFDQSRVIFKTGNFVKISLMESTETYEDSCVISKKAAGKLGTSIIKSKSFIVKAENEILDMLPVGTKVEPNDLLFTITDGNKFGKDNMFDKSSLEVLQNIKNRSPKAKMRGKIVKIIIYYNCELEDLSKNLRQLAEASNIELAKDEMSPGLTGKVNASYSIKGKSLSEGSVEIKVKIRDMVDMGIGDKAVISNQLKSTVGDVFNYDIISESGDEIEALFSASAIANRIVNSPSLIGTTTTILKKVGANAVDMYFK